MSCFLRPDVTESVSHWVELISLIHEQIVQFGFVNQIRQLMNPMSLLLSCTYGFKSLEILCTYRPLLWHFIILLMLLKLERSRPINCTVITCKILYDTLFKHMEICDYVNCPFKRAREGIQLGSPLPGRRLCVSSPPRRLETQISGLLSGAVKMCFSVLELW